MSEELQQYKEEKNGGGLQGSSYFNFEEKMLFVGKRENRFTGG